MFARIANLIGAVFAFLLALDLQLGFLPSRYARNAPHLPTGLGEIAFDFFVCVWMTGAIGLFFRRRYAWVFSLLGVGVSACFFATAAAIVIWVWLFPDAQSQSNTSFGVSGFVATVITIVIGVGGLSAFTALFVTLFVGLVRMRHELR